MRQILEKLNRDITQIDSIVAWHYPRRSALSYCNKSCQMNRPSVGKTVYTWPDADVWESSAWIGVMFRTKVLS